MVTGAFIGEANAVEIYTQNDDYQINQQSSIQIFDVNNTDKTKQNKAISGTNTNSRSQSGKNLSFGKHTKASDRVDLVEQKLSVFQNNN